MNDTQECLDIDDTINKLLIDHIRERPTLHYTDTDTYTESDERHWDQIQKSTGIQKSWLKKRWKTIRNEHRKITIYNHIHSKKVPLHKMAQNLSFFVVDLNGANKMDFTDLIRPKKESFCITQEMLDNCDISESVTADTISVQKSKKHEPDADSHSKSQTSTEQPSKGKEKNTSNEDQNISDKSKNIEENVNKKDVKSQNSQNERCEDTIFGELVVAMLKKMSPDEKKRAKKEIMNILL